MWTVSYFTSCDNNCNVQLTRSARCPTPSRHGNTQQNLPATPSSALPVGENLTWFLCYTGLACFPIVDCSACDPVSVLHCMVSSAFQSSTVQPVTQFLRYTVSSAFQSSTAQPVTQFLCYTGLVCFPVVDCSACDPVSVLHCLRLKKPTPAFAGAASIGFMPLRSAGKRPQIQSATLAVIVAHCLRLF